MSPRDNLAVGRIAEVFRSFQGEGLLLGRRQVFVRLAGCTVGCRYCDTEWAFEVPARVAVPGSEPPSHLENPLTVDQVLELVTAADPEGTASVSLTGGEPLEQPGFVADLVTALAPRDVMLETSALQTQALELVAPRVRWVACDLKLPTATGRAGVLEEHEEVLRSGALDGVDSFFKLVVDGETTDAEVDHAARLLSRYAPGRPVFLQPVTPLGGSPALPRARLDALATLLLGQGLDLRVVPQVHKVLRVR